MAPQKIHPPIAAGKRFGRLVVLAEAQPYINPKTGHKARKWRCECDCGVQKEIQQGALNAGITVSCGCLRRERAIENLRQETSPINDLLGGVQRFGRLTVIGEDTSEGLSQRHVFCRCDCGSERSFNIYVLLSGGARSCGCLRTEKTIERCLTHGQASAPRRTAEYRAWSDAKSRCYNPKVRNYPEYGGRGIRMCDKWRNSFEAFFADMGRRPGPEYSIDRWPNGDGDYEPGNCRWATSSQQGRNSRANRKIYFRGEVFSLIEASERFGLKQATIGRRLNHGWTVADALLTPARKSRRWG